MIEEIEFRFEEKLDEYPNRLAVTAFDAAGQPLLEETYGAESSVGVVDRALFRSESVLNGNRTDLIKCVDTGRWISALPGNDTPIALDVRNLYNDSSHLEEPLPIEKETLIDGIIEFAEWYRNKLAETGGDPCALTRLNVGIADARRRLEYYGQHDSFEGYQPTIEREHLETFLFECRSNDRLREFVAQTGEIEPFVRELPSCEDDEYVKEAYGKLFTYEYDDVARNGLETLSENPDARASNTIVGISFESDPSLAVPALEVYSQANPDMLLDLVSTHLSADEPEIVRAAIDAVAALEIADLDSDQRDLAIRRLEKAKDNIEHPSLRSRIDDALANFEA